MNLLSEQDIALAWIGVSDPIALGGNFKDSEHVKNFAANLEAAILAKLASAELPEPLKTFEYPKGKCQDLYSADQLRQAYAQGAASQLSAEPSAFLDVVMDCAYTMHELGGETVDSFTPLYTRREA